MKFKKSSTVALALAALAGTGVAISLSSQSVSTSQVSEILDFWPGTNLGLATSARSSHFVAGHNNALALQNGRCEFVFKEKDPAGGEFEEVTQKESFAFVISAVSGRPDGLTYYVAGLSKNQEIVVEEITFQKRKNGVHIDVSIPASAGIGTALPSFSATEVLPIINPNGAPGFDPLSQNGYSSSSRKEIMRDSTRPDELIRSIACDYEGRAIYLLYRFGDVVQVDLSDLSTSVIATVTSCPALFDARQMELHEFTGGGRALVTYPYYSSVVGPGVKYGVIIDTQNDAVFDNTFSLTSAEFRTDLYNDLATWANVVDHCAPIDLSGW